ncbi:hypothetical protein R1sor_008367 [Riccia sorocarpa]|uniref:Uncharacterized protein n=1 Tax=Riccia sorocarpa TaxID=122646 RepID=A0ABD3HVC0_9MARC
MVCDPGRAPSEPHPSQGGQPDRRERHRTHSTSASDLSTTPSTVGGGRPPAHPRKSSGSGAGASGSMSSGGRTPGVTTGAASRGSTPQTSIPVTTSAPTPPSRLHRLYNLLVRWGWGLLHLDLEVELRLNRRIPPDIAVLDHPMRMMQSLVVDVADDLLLTSIETVDHSLYPW